MEGDVLWEALETEPARRGWWGRYRRLERPPALSPYRCRHAEITAVLPRLAVRERRLGTDSLQGAIWDWRCS